MNLRLLLCLHMFIYVYKHVYSLTGSLPHVVIENNLKWLYILALDI